MRVSLIPKDAGQLIQRQESTASWLLPEVGSAKVQQSSRPRLSLGADIGFLVAKHELQAMHDDLVLIQV